MNTFLRVREVLARIMGIPEQEIPALAVLSELVLPEPDSGSEYQPIAEDSIVDSLSTDSLGVIETMMLAADVAMTLKAEFALAVSADEVEQEFVRLVLSKEATVQQLSDYVESQLPPI